MRANIDAWWPHVEQGAEAIVITASGCGTMVTDYGRQLVGDAAYAAKAARIASLARDISEVVFAEKGDLLLLGARSLEGLNLTVDSRRKKQVAAGPLLAATALRMGVTLRAR